MLQLGFLLCESMCVSSGSKCVGVMSEENGSKGRIARLSVSKEGGGVWELSDTRCRLSGCFYEILLQVAQVKQMRVKPREIRLCKQSNKLCTYTCTYTCTCLERPECFFCFFF